MDEDSDFSSQVKLAVALAAFAAGVVGIVAFFKVSAAKESKAAFDRGRSSFSAGFTIDAAPSRHMAAWKDGFKQAESDRAAEQVRQAAELELAEEDRRVQMAATLKAERQRRQEEIEFILANQTQYGQTGTSHRRSYSSSSTPPSAFTQEEVEAASAIIDIGMLLSDELPHDVRQRAADRAAYYGRHGKYPTPNELPSAFLP
jgi:hypothetical protein